MSQIKGLMNFLQQKYQTLSLQIKASDGAMSDAELTDHVKETLKQLGIDPVSSNRNQEKNRSIACYQNNGKSLLIVTGTNEVNTKAISQLALIISLTIMLLVVLQFLR